MPSCQATLPAIDLDDGKLPENFLALPGRADDQNDRYANSLMIVLMARQC